MKTRDEVEALKAVWKGDPVFDLLDIEGFEEYRDELRQFAIERHMEQESAQAARKARLVKNWYELEINECFWPSNNTEVMRVPGGWVVTNYQCNASETAMSQSSVFIPFVPPETYLPKG